MTGLSQAIGASSITPNVSTGITVSTKLSGINIGATNIAYVSGDVIGTLQTLTNLARVNGGGISIQTNSIGDTSGSNGALQLHFYDTDPSTGSTIANGTHVVIYAVTLN